MHYSNSIYWSALLQCQVSSICFYTNFKKTYKTFASTENMKTKAMMIQPSLVSMAVNCVLDSACDTHLAKLMYLVDKLKQQLSDWCSYATKWWEAGYKNKNGRNECDKMVTQQWYTEWKTLINPNLVQHWQSSLW